jgi:hypothetical protein
VWRQHNRHRKAQSERLPLDACQANHQHSDGTPGRHGWFASSPTTIFDSAQDQQVVAVLTLANLNAGTKISYTRYLNNKYVNSRSALLKKRAKYLYFTFKPKPGEKFTPGSYRMKFYVNEKASGEINYQIN